ncbi:MAG: hypothetical protein ABIQ93_08690 [Saprospiraceae bacterium]
MRILLSLFMMLITICSFVVGLIWVLAKSLSQTAFNPGSKAWKNALDGLRTRLHTSALVPWDGEMLSLLSLNQRVGKKPGWLDNTTEGVFTSIYQEPILAYAERKSGNNAILLARTSDREFVFRRKGKETEIWVNSQPLGTYVDGVLLSSDSKSRLLARVEIEAGESQYPVLFGTGTAASINNPALPGRSPNPRALTLLRDLQPEEESALLALAVLQMTKGGGS